jgi:hypothetical protein
MLLYTAQGHIVRLSFRPVQHESYPTPKHSPTQTSMAAQTSTR